MDVGRHSSHCISNGPAFLEKLPFGGRDGGKQKLRAVESGSDGQAQVPAKARVGSWGQAADMSNFIYSSE